MQVNFQATKRGVQIERIVILGSNLWVPTEILPVPEVKAWVDEQHERGIKVFLVRESEISGEADLLCDFGIYGERATGISLYVSALQIRKVLSIPAEAKSFPSGLNATQGTTPV
jgi:hypothetical protein